MQQASQYGNGWAGEGPPGMKIKIALWGALVVRVR
jgi:hypothetical protein